MKFSDLIAKPIISLYNSRIEGVIISANFNHSLTKILSLIIENKNESDLNDEFEIKCKNVFSIGQDAVMIKNDSLLKGSFTLENPTYNPINMSVFSTSGKELGRVKDLEFDKNFNITNIYTNSAQFQRSEIANISEELILISDKKNPLTISRLKPKSIKIQCKNYDEQKTVIMPICQNEIASEKDEIDIKNQKISTISTIQRVSSTTSSLLGKTVTQTILSQNGEIIAKIGNKITSNTISLASAHQKLRELCFYAK